MHGRRCDGQTCYRARTLKPSTYVANHTYKDRRRRPHPQISDDFAAIGLSLAGETVAICVDERTQ